VHPGWGGGPRLAVAMPDRRLPGPSSTGAPQPGLGARPDLAHSSAGPAIAVENLWVPCAKKAQICVLLGEIEWIIPAAVRGPWPLPGETGSITCVQSGNGNWVINSKCQGR
jgi:hypothetical protein